MYCMWYHNLICSFEFFEGPIFYLCNFIFILCYNNKQTQKSAVPFWLQNTFALLLIKEQIVANYSLFVFGYLIVFRQLKMIFISGRDGLFFCSVHAHVSPLKRRLVFLQRQGAALWCGLSHLCILPYFIIIFIRQLKIINKSCSFVVHHFRSRL